MALYKNGIDMFGIGKRPVEPTAEASARTGVLQSLKNSLRRTREGLLGGLTHLFRSGRAIDAATLDEIADSLLLADVGMEATELIIGRLRARQKQQKFSDSEALYSALHEEMAALLRAVEQPLDVTASVKKPFVLLMVGVNGAGKTTTIGKLAQQFKQRGLSVMLAAGDTFRAAAVEQLSSWGERLNVPVVAQATGADAASVIYDALAAATARGVDVLIADTAGRLHTRDNLMEELKKVRRVLAKIDESAPHEVMLVLDATTGQNGLAQAENFRNAVGITGIALTKMDGTAKGGIVFAIATKLGIPVRYIGVGEKADDLREFSANEFVDAILDRNQSE
ncbi:MAG: signal recognition particle-docking protein FtsY [Gammaproteobacteria bacterium]